MYVWMIHNENSRCWAWSFFIIHKVTHPVLDNWNQWSTPVIPAQVEAGEPKVQDHPWLCSRFEDTLRYIRPCLKNKAVKWKGTRKTHPSPDLTPRTKATNYTNHWDCPNQTAESHLYLTMESHQFLRSLSFPHQSQAALESSAPEGTLYKLCTVQLATASHSRGRHSSGFFLPNKSPVRFVVLWHFP